MNDAVSWLPGNAKSTRVIQASAQFQPKDEIPATVVYERAGGVTPQDIASVTAQIAKFNALAPVARPSVGPIPSRDKSAIRVEVPINAGSAGWDKLSAAVTDMRSIAKASPAGLSVHFTGPGGFAADSSAAFSGIDGKLLYSALAVVIFILLITYRSPVLWLLPVVSAGLALTVAQAVVYLLARNGLTVNAQSAGILTVLVFGAGTDYALLLVARYREELRRHEDRHEAMAFALHRVGPAIFASGSTVIAGMLCLLVASMNSTQGLGPVAAVGIAVGLMVMLTLLPALLVIFGRWFFWPVHPTFGSVDHTATGVWAKVGARIARAPRATWIATSAALIVAGVGVFQLNAVGLQNRDAFFGTPDSVVGEQVLADHFPAGAGQPVIVIANADRATAVRTALTGVGGISGVAPPVVKGDRVLLAGTLAVAPDSQAAIDTVGRVRDAVHQVPGAQAIARGDSATRGDILQAASNDNKGDHPADPVRGVPHPDAVAPGGGRAADPDRDRGPLIRGRDGTELAGLPTCLQLRRRRLVAPALRIRLPGGPRDRLQHLPDDEGARGGQAVRHQAWRPHRAGRDRWRDHVSRPGAGWYVLGPGHSAGGGVRRDRVRRCPGCPARHADRALGAGDGAEPGRRPAHVVAEQPCEQTGFGRATSTRHGYAPGCGLRCPQANPDRLTVSRDRTGLREPPCPRTAAQPMRSATSGGKPPVATGPQLVGVIRISDLPCRAMARLYSSQSGCSPAMERK